MQTAKTFLKVVIVSAIRGYKFAISPLLGSNCRFYPFCSDYAIQAINTHGIIRGLLLGLWRVIRCNPLSSGGEDPVPTNKSTVL